MNVLVPLSYSRLSTFETCPQKFDYLYISKLVKDEDNEFTIYGTRVHEALEKACRDGEPLPENLSSFAPLVSRILDKKGEKFFEHQMAIRRDRTPCDWFDENVWIRGIADVLVIDGIRAWCIDWKTGKPRNNPTQLQLFAALILEVFPQVETVTTAYVWLHHNEVSSTEYHRKKLDSIWAALEPRFVKVQETVDLGVFEAKPSYLCNYCAAKHICSSAKM